MNPIARYMHWLHTRWPAGEVEQLPDVREDGSTSLPGVYVVGDLTGIPLLKFSADSGARAVETITEDPSFQNRDTSDDEVADIVIVGCGVSGVAAAAEADKRGLSHVVLEAVRVNVFVRRVARPFVWRQHRKKDLLLAALGLFAVQVVAAQRAVVVAAPV